MLNSSKYFRNKLSDIKVLFVIFLSLNGLTGCESPKLKMSQPNTLVFHQQYEVNGLKFDLTKPNTRNGISLFWLQVYNQADIEEPNQKIRYKITFYNANNQPISTVETVCRESKANKKLMIPISRLAQTMNNSRFFSLLAFDCKPEVQ